MVCFCIDLRCADTVILVLSRKMRNSGSTEDDGTQLVSADAYGNLPDVSSRRDKALDIGLSQDDMTSGSVSQEEIAAALAKSMADQFTPSHSVNPIPVGLPPLGMPPAGMPPAGMPPAGMPPAGLPPLGQVPSGMPPVVPQKSVPKLPQPAPQPAPQNCSIDNNTAAPLASSHWSASWLVNGAMERLRSNVR